MYWAISLHKQYVKSFLEGDKKVEVRTRVPKTLNTGDWVFVIQTDSGGRVVMRMRVRAIWRMSPELLWERMSHSIQVNYLAYAEYFKGKRIAYGILIDEVDPITEEVYFEELGLNKAPQWFSMVKRLGRLAK